MYRDFPPQSDTTFTPRLMTSHKRNGKTRNRPESDRLSTKLSNFIEKEQVDVEC